ncbi:cobyric acid synthase [Brucella melitensis]|nr:cobyric acid synthase [Brucella melitensis]
MGTYLHGVFSADRFRHHFLRALGVEGGQMNYRESVEEALGELAEGLEASLDIDGLFALA